MGPNENGGTILQSFEDLNRAEHLHHIVNTIDEWHCGLPDMLAYKASGEF